MKPRLSNRIQFSLAYVLVAAVGVPGIVRAEMVKEGAAVIDVASISASGLPSRASKHTSTAWCVGRSSFRGNTETSFVVSAPDDGR